MSTYPQRKSDYEASLIKELMQLVHQFDNKSHNYFISTLLTGVLMHHLSWVNTVAPPEANTVSSLLIGITCYLHLIMSYFSISGAIMEITIHCGHS